jgi:tetratricopeptide (TPR) repeat protein
MARGVVVMGALAGLLLLVPTDVQARAAHSAAATERAHRARARAIFDRGRKEFNLGKFKKALSFFTRAYDLVPLSGFLFNIAQCQRFLGNCKKAVFLYKGYLRDNPGSPNTRVVLGLVKSCEQKLRRELLKRGRAQQLFQEGVTFYKLGRFADAVDRYARAYKILGLPGYLFALGQGHHKLARYKKAIHFYQMYLRDNPGTPETKSIERLIDECRKKHSAALRRARGGLAPGTVLGGAGRTRPEQGRSASRPVYKQWWFWTAVGVGVAVLVGGLAGGLARTESQGLTVPPSDLGTQDWR